MRHRIPLSLAAEIAAAVQLTARAASTELGVDCLRHAEMAAHLLRHEGLNGVVAAGYAAWRLHGTDPGAVVAHQSDAEILPGSKGMVFHTWVEVRDQILDVTGYQLRVKMTRIDLADGRVTPVAWAPDHILLRKRQVVPWATVRDGRLAGLCHYARVPEIEARVRQCPPMKPYHLNAGAQLLKMIQRGQAVRVVGPIAQATFAHIGRRN